MSTTHAPEDVLAVLGLDPEVVRMTAETADGYGSFLAATPGRGHLIRAATMKALAGSCWCFVDSTRAQAAFGQSGLLYQHLNRSFAAVLSVCGGEGLAHRTKPRLFRTPDDFAFQAVGLAWTLVNSPDDQDATATELDALAAYGAHLQPYPVGHLEVPLRLYLEFGLDLAVTAQGESSSSLTQSLSRLLERGSEPLQMAMADRYHWPIIGTDIMPIEAELLAVARIGNRALGDWDDDLLDQLGIPDGLERVPLWVAQFLDAPPEARSRLPGTTRPLPPLGEKATTIVAGMTSPDEGTAEPS